MKRKKRRASLFLSLMEVRAIEYIVRELAKKRELFEVMDDPYVRNRITPTRRHALQEDEELLEAFKAEIAKVRKRLEEDGTSAAGLVADGQEEE
jgi:hypothetical protein